MIEVARLEKPYTLQQRIDFIVSQQNAGCMIEITDTAIISKKRTAEEEEELKRQEIEQYSMSRGDFFEAMILAKGVTKAELRAMIENMDLDEKTRMIYLNRFDEALNFYRGYPIFDALSTQLGITSEQLDEFFKTKDYTKLLSEVDNG